MFDFLKDTDMVSKVIVAISAAVVTAFFSRLHHSRSIRSVTAKERMLQYFEPLMQISELHLFCYKPKEPAFLEAMEKINAFLDMHRLHIGYDVYESFLQFRGAEKKSKVWAYNRFCEKFLRRYNSLCKQSGYEKISFWYRIAHRLGSRKRVILYVSLYTFRHLLVLCGAIMIMFAALGLVVTGLQHLLK